MEKVTVDDLKKLYLPKYSQKGENGQVTIIGGSRLFHGAPLLAIKTASRIVDMVFFVSPEATLAGVAERLKSKLASFIWVPYDEVGEYIRKSDAVLIGPGFMRFRRESQKLKGESQNLDEAGKTSKEITERLLRRFPEKQWVIDAGSLQVMGPEFIPQDSILTPNRKELALLFGLPMNKENLVQMAQKYSCVIVGKGPETIVCSAKESVLVEGGNVGMTKGGTGDVLAGLTVALAAKNEPFLAASAAVWVVKRAADELYKKVGFAYNADDLTEKIPAVLGKYWR